MAKLAAYRAKRDFSSTPEPDGREGEGHASFAFVIQKHDATRLHYDLRLELDGVMKSWAVAKGPSLVPGEKRLAIHVEDHPIAYNTFEGTIPKGQYGGGTVLLWDRGRWAPRYDPHKGLAKGHLEFELAGEKLAGAWHLVRLRKKPGERQEAWLLIKSEDEAARAAGDPDILDEKPLSVATGRDLAAIAAARDGAVWDSNHGMAAEARAGREAQPARNAPSPLAGEGGAAKPRRMRGHPAAASHPSSDLASRGHLLPQGEKGRRVSDTMPKSVEPCLATLVAAPPSGPLWLHEVKWDGYRLVAFLKDGTVRLATRRGHDWTGRFPGIAEALAALPVATAILDGEAVILNGSGVADFSALQAALSDEGRGAARDAIFYGFDLLYLDGRDWRGEPLERRKERLAGLLPPDGTGTLRLGEHLDTDGRAMFRSACAMGLEGIISKRRDRPYGSGRSDDWVKAKCLDRQDFVVLGFTPSAAARGAIGSLVLGYHEEGRLRLAGRAGTGYSGAVARALFKALEPTRIKVPSLAARPTTEERRNVVWVEPSRVAEIEFRGWTGDDRLRQAAFKGMREDKVAAEVVRERPAASVEDGSTHPPHAEVAAAGGPRSTRNRLASFEARPPAPPGGRAPQDEDVRSMGPSSVKSAAHPRGDATVAGVRLSHPERVLWPGDGITKRDLAGFYEEIAEWLLPQVAGRPLSLLRCPAGHEDGCFFQKHAGAGLDDRIGRRTVRDEAGEAEEVLFVQDIAGVVALVQASVLEIHPWGASVEEPDRPDRMVIDLDPGEGVPFAGTIAAAREVRERLAALGLESFVKTTGGKGLHVVAPLAGPAGWAEVKAFAKALADAMAADSPDRFIAKATKAARRGLIYVDYLRNGRGATAVAAYSTRARAGATVSVPLRWEDLGPKLDPASFTVETLPARLRRRRGDPWAELFASRQRLPQAGATRRKKTRAGR